MNLILEKDHTEHGEQGRQEKHAGHSTKAFLRKFWVNLVLSVPVVLYSDILRELFSWEPPAFPGSQYIPLLLGSVIFFWGGWIFLASSVRELKAKSPGMMTLIALAITTAYSYSVFVVLRGYGDTLFWELSTLIVVMLLGHWMEMRAVQGAQGALRELSKLLPDTAEVIENPKSEARNPKQILNSKFQIRTIPVAELRVGNIVLVKPGGKIPADGMVVEGQSEVDESIATGESKLVAKKSGNEVIAGTVNGDGSLQVQVTKIGEHTFLAGVMRLVAEAQASKSKLQILSDKAAYWLTLIAIGASSLTFLVWIFLRAEFGFALERLVAVLVIACPHALGLAIPLVASISTSMAAKHGFLVKQRLALEAARNVDIVLFDKTGTLTKGEFGVTRAENTVLQLAASVDAHSEHFVARALVAEAHKRGLSLLPIEGFSRIPGKGAKGIIEGVEIRVEGSDSAGAQTMVSVFKGNENVGTIALVDVIREESREAIQDLKAMGIEIAMMTGDSEGVASWVAQELGIGEYFAKVLPHQKSEKIKLLQSKGKKVAMVGDGINDAPALTQADLGIAIGAGTNVAIESAGIILMRNDPRDIPKIIRLSKLTFSKMIQNLFWATGYNVVALPLAAGALAFKGIVLEPALAALFMSLSTVIVAINAMFLRRKVL